ncbi:MAG: hypothetical protein ACREN4_02630 [Candidatus Dormibacteria bacterium]
MNPQPLPFAAPDRRPGEELPEDIELNEAGRNWVSRQSEAAPRRSVRQLAADAAVTAAIGQVYGA